MKSILLTSTALVAFAGAAAADGHTSITHTMTATLGYTSNDNYGSKDAPQFTAGDDGVFGTADDKAVDGFFWEGNLKTKATAALDNGITAGAYFEITVSEDGSSNVLTSSDFVISLESETASLYFGDTETAAKTRWVSAGDMEADGFSEDLDSNVLRGDVTFGGVQASIGYIADDVNDEATQLSFGAAGTFGAFAVSAAYQEDTTYVDGSGDFSQAEVFGVSASGTFANATVTLAYAQTTSTVTGVDDLTSIGGKIRYPFGPVILAGYFVAEAGGDKTAATFEEPNFGINVAYDGGPIKASLDYQDDQGTPKFIVEGSYDLGNGMTVLAGALNENDGDDVDFFAGGSYNLGGGAVASVVYATDVDGDQGNEIGSGEYDAGFTVQVDFTF